jgi:Fibronectin type III domain
MLVSMYRVALGVVLVVLCCGSSEAGKLTFAWDVAQDGVTSGYEIRYGIVPGIYTESIDVGNVTSHTIDTLTDGVRYYIAVFAYNPDHEFGPPSNEVSGIPTSTTTVGVPTSLSGTVNGAAVNLAWQAPLGALTGFRIEVGTMPGQSDVGTVDIGQATTHSVTGLAAGRTYYIRARTLNATLVSLPSNEIVITIPAGNVPQPPTELSAWRRFSSIYLYWQAPTTGTVTGYRVEIGTSPGESDVAVGDIPAASSYWVRGLSPGTYYFRVRTLTAAGLSAPSNEVQRTVRSTW